MKKILLLTAIILTIMFNHIAFAQTQTIKINSISKVKTYFNSRLKINILNLLDDEGIVSRERVNDFKKWLDK
jgi:hypothetical protein